jgi:hypothetical protein
MAALRANNRGVGWMEQFEYAKAEPEFEEAIRQAPGWLPGRINLGIALLNQHTSNDKMDRATKLFKDILNEQPDNPYAHHCLGIILDHRGDTVDALEHFRRVTEIDPKDPYAWFHLGQCWATMAQSPDADPKETTRCEQEARHCFERTRSLDPCFGPAVFRIGMLMRTEDLTKAKGLIEEAGELVRSVWDDGPSKLRYSEMGHYAEVISNVGENVAGPRIGPLPLFARDQKLEIRLRPGARWAKAADFGKGPAGELRAKLRARFGAVLVALDYNRDRMEDLFLLGAVVENGQVCDLLLRNDGGGSYTDVTNEAGLGGPSSSLGCCVGDFNNDGYPDLFITGIGKQRLLRNNGLGRFEDVTKEAGLDNLTTVCLGGAFVDLDQDGDLDLLIAQYAATTEEALALLSDAKQKATSEGSGLAVYLNIGESVATDRGSDPPPLPPRFKRADKPAALVGKATPVTGLAITDLDDDQDIDILVLADQAAPDMVLNDRLLRFHREALPAALAGKERWNGALVLDQDHDGRSDLFLLPAGQSPLLLLNRSKHDSNAKELRFEKGVTNSPPLLQAQAVDIDLDGWTDIVGLSAEHKPVLLHNDGRRLVHRHEALGADAAWPGDLIAVNVTFSGEDGFADLLVWSESLGLQRYVNQKNGNHGLLLEVTGHRRIDKKGEPTRTNADAIGVRVTARAEDHWTSAERTTQSAGLGQSRRPLQLGMGRFPRPDVVSLRWPDIVWQAELDLICGQFREIDETNRKETSCPVLFTWNGKRFEFVSDFLGAGSMGELAPDGTCRPPRPEESVKIEAEQLVPLDGSYVLKVAEPMNEVIYLDRLQLIVLDHPPDVRVYPDERFVSTGPPASQDLLAFRREIYPVTARDHRSRDVTQTLRHRDRLTVDNFARRAWLGYAEEHWVELDFGDRLAAFGPKDRLLLCLAGWTDYPYPESIWAATQAGVALLPPTLERLGTDGKWQTLVVDAGFPAGLPRMMPLDVTGLLGGSRCVVRLRTNMNVYWDQIFVAPLLDRVPAAVASAKGYTSGVIRATPLQVSQATLETCGCAQEFSPDGRQPTIYDHERRESVPVARLAGRLTRTGPVTELLQDQDDRFVIFGPGDEVTARFDARRLPDLPRGWTRSFVLRTWGYSKDNGPFTATGDTVEPLPFRSMSKYPYGPDEHYPNDPVHEEYRRRYNTRSVGAQPHPVKARR